MHHKIIKFFHFDSEKYLGRQLLFAIMFSKSSRQNIAIDKILKCKFVKFSGKKYFL